MKRTIREIMTEFRHVSIPRDYVFDVFPFMRPRQFSIASSDKVSLSRMLWVHRESSLSGPSTTDTSLCRDRQIPDKTQGSAQGCLYKLLVNTETRFSRISDLHSTGWYTSHAGAKLNIEIQRGLINLPPSVNTPIICVGPGTGVASMRAIIEERLSLGSQCMLHFSHGWNPG